MSIWKELKVLIWIFVGMSGVVFGMQLSINYYIQWKPYGEVCKPTGEQRKLREIEAIILKETGDE